MESRALQIIPTRGDSFDIGSREVVRQEPDIIRMLQNPEELQGFLDLTPSQASNLRSLIVGGGTGGIHRLLSKHLGDEASAAVGALVSVWAAKKLLGRS